MNWAGGYDDTIITFFFSLFWLLASVVCDMLDVSELCSELMEEVTVNNGIEWDLLDW